MIRDDLIFLLGSVIGIILMSMHTAGALQIVWVFELGIPNLLFVKLLYFIYGS